MRSDRSSQVLLVLPEPYFLGFERIPNPGFFGNPGFSNDANSSVKTEIRENPVS